MCISHRCMARMSSLQAYAAQLRILAPLLAPLARSILLRFIHRRRFGCSASGRAGSLPNCVLAQKEQARCNPPRHLSGTCAASSFWWVIFAKTELSLLSFFTNKFIFRWQPQNRKQKQEQRQTLSCRTQDMQKSHTRTPTHIYAHKCVYTHTRCK